ncbi:DNA-binding response regulator, NarL/FixJ family, contains REC and HTH domains [Tessaracoccus bendigoensis DSM 12906]|uniref:DNA-binding response regulator, NarL/FixJ family, contains REC and HTH domains n=1 Tax=Tessaracoccus bendigoensis DSM 12906 TaxID=1123357 RepID=A0A1M6B6P1_9ACTN|nr:response regulator transcription factor [Tessaracoccus bendigoensis]SHI44350.1 DNA-binding response regulator, NarL/FixJ family, contains REC and HTH domains [Tessaracoccus bendigoensis DSM 12906]
MIKVLLADDQSLVRSGFRMLIDSADDMETVGEVDNGRDAVAMVRTRPVDVVLMDIRMPVMDGAEATQQISRLGLDTKVLVLTTFDLDEYVFAALRGGASGFLLKDALPEELLGAIRSVAAGDAVVAPSTTKRLLTHFAGLLPKSDPGASGRLDTLTEREREVLGEVARGANNQEIAERLYMAEGTVKTHIGRLLSKLDARDRVGLVLIALEEGLGD